MGFRPLTHVGALTLLLSLACALPERAPITASDCHCQLQPASGMIATDELVEGAPIQLGNALLERYLVVEIVPRDQMVPRSLAGWLDVLPEETETWVAPLSYDTIAGYPAAWRDAEMDFADVGMLRRRYVVIDAPHGLLIAQTWTLAGRWDQLEGPAMEMIRSLEVLPDPPAPPFLDAPAVGLDVRPLLEARAQADLPVQAWSMDSDVELPPGSPFERITYRSEELQLKAFLSTPDAAGPHPAVLWVEGGFGGPAVPWERGPVEDDQSAMDFVEAGFVVLAPSFRGELDNPGEMGPFYGETTDLLSALTHLRTLDGVDPQRIYLVGHSTGGTNVLLAAAAGAEARATVVFGGRAHVEPELYELPIVLSDEGARLRSALHWADDLTHPVYYFGGDDEWLVDGATMARAATEAGRTMTVHSVPRTDHFTMLTPARRVLIPKMLADDPSGPPFTVTEPELLAAVMETWPATEGPPSGP